MSRLALLALGLLLSSATACGTPRVNLITGTTIGLKATPGDGETRPPQVTLGYKRAEVALVPTSGMGATAETDAQSTLASFHFSTRWFGHTEIDSFIATGNAARALSDSSDYTAELAKVTLGVVPDAIQQRRAKLATRADGLTEPQAEKVLTTLNYDKKPGKTAQESLKDYIVDAQTDVLVGRLESAFFQLP
jgi:hypothetical protein